MTLKTDVLVPSRASGAILKINVREGETVERGQLLAELELTIAMEDHQASIHEAKVYELHETMISIFA